MAKIIAYRDNQVTPTVPFIVDQVEADIINRINNMNIFNIENIKCYFIIHENKILTFVWAEDIAREGGLTKTNIKNYAPTSRRVDLSGTGTYEYDSIRWKEFNDYVNDYIEARKQYDPEIDIWTQRPIHKNSWIPLRVALNVLMRMNNPKAVKFRDIIVDIIEPQIVQNTINIYREMYREKLIQQQESIDSLNNYLNTDNLYTSDEIAKLFNMTPQVFNRLLNKLQVIYPVNGTWLPYKRIMMDGLCEQKINKFTGNPMIYWTKGGRDYCIHLLKYNGFEENKNNNKLIQEFLGK